MDGVLLVDKPLKITSAGVLRKLKFFSPDCKIGHTGTLDPDATGLLVVLLGKATRMQDYLMKGYKTYEGLIKLGISTNTDDISGSVIQKKPIPTIDELVRLLPNVVSHFSGVIVQTPPKFSALKINGKRAYDLARQGIKFETIGRKIEITELALDIQHTDSISLKYRVKCSSGTYVRSLARDIGEFINSCACIESIRRIESGFYRVKDAVPFESISETDYLRSNVLPLSTIFSKLPKYSLNKENIEAIRKGKQVCLSSLPTLGEDSRYSLVVDEFGQAVSVLQLDTESEKNRWRIGFVINSA